MYGLWSSAEALHTKKSQKPPCLIQDPWSRRFLIFSNRIFCSDFITKFFNTKMLLRDQADANISLAYKGTFRDVIIRSIWNFYTNTRFNIMKSKKTISRPWLLGVTEKKNKVSGSRNQTLPLPRCIDWLIDSEVYSTPLLRMESGGRGFESHTRDFFSFFNICAATENQMIV